ncbi:MAG TPA: hypoxanthine-guanine phosphoribosyltransferase [Chromatiaceae bacterium]|nr:hypoxanthine-guanine phosphoribosyltransferase [Chromatiaceae bacterium]
MNRTLQMAKEAMANAELVFSRQQVEDALDKMAEAISKRLRHADPLVLVVMNGGLIPAGMLLPRLVFPLKLDYIHATRYRERTFGADLHWRKKPDEELRDRTLLIIDDILDEGYTLEAIIDYCRKSGASEVLTAVLVKKAHLRGNALEADFTGLVAPDRYLFGYGMDYQGYWRNVPGIYAVSEGESI